MALDFHRLDNKEHIFGLDDKQFEALSEIFEEFKYRTGLTIDQYSDFKMTKENQLAIIKIIDEYISKNDLNRNKFKTIAIIEFRLFLLLLSSKNIDLKLIGD